MNSYKTTTELKSEARELLLGKYGSYIGAMVIIESILFIISLIVSSVLPTDTVWGIALDMSITFIINLISAVFSLGIIHFTLNMCRSLPYQIGDIWYGFSSHPDKAIICRFLFGIMEILCLLPAILFIVLYSITENELLTVVIAILLIIAMYAIVIMHLTYDFVYYTMLDYPDASIKQLFVYCSEVMKGHRVRLFYLQVSFLPLLILSVFSFGIGLLFVIPYQNVAISNFYLDVFHPNCKDTDITTGVISQNITEGIY